MKITETKLEGAFLVEAEARQDERGEFARTFCQREFAAAGLSTAFVQCNYSLNRLRGTLRGMHYQAEPQPEGKLVRCTRGEILDVILDLRPRSRTYLRWVAVELTEENHRALYIPPGFAHGFQTLTDGAEVFYQMTEYYVPELARGVRFDDPAFKIDWPIADPILSEKDRTYPDFHA